MSDRVSKINTVIEKTVSALLANDVDFKPGVFVTISKVDTSSDLRYTRVFVRIFPQKELPYALATLEHERRALQKKLHDALPMRTVPQLSFVHDPRGDEADTIDRLLQSDH